MSYLRQEQLVGAINSTKIPTGPTWKSGPPQKVDPVFRNFSVGPNRSLRFGPKFPEILVEWIAPRINGSRHVARSNGNPAWRAKNLRMRTLRSRLM